jgi:hypothetical protein
LERRIGAAAFERLLRRYMVEEVRTTHQLIGYLREIAGEDAAEWFSAELMRGPASEPATD